MAKESEKAIKRRSETVLACGSQERGEHDGKHIGDRQQVDDKQPAPGKAINTPIGADDEPRRE